MVTDASNSNSMRENGVIKPTTASAPHKKNLCAYIDKCQHAINGRENLPADTIL